MTNKDIIEIIKMEGTATRALMRAEIDRIEEMDRVRNGKIHENCDAVKRIDRETRWARWATRNAKLAIMTFIIGVSLVLITFNALNVRRTIEKMTKIEFKKDEEI